MLHKIVRPDSKGRITLGHLAKGISGFKVTIENDHKLILEPYVEIPANERWLFDNKKALTTLKKGLDDAASGRLTHKGSFAKFKDDDTK